MPTQRLVVGGRVRCCGHRDFGNAPCLCLCAAWVKYIDLVSPTAVCKTRLCVFGSKKKKKSIHSIAPWYFFWAQQKVAGMGAGRAPEEIMAMKQEALLGLLQPLQMRAYGNHGFEGDIGLVL